MQSIKVVLQNEVGLHARPAALLAKEAANFKSAVFIEKNGRNCNAKSIFSILSLGACKGDELSITAEGEDEINAVNTLKSLIESFKE